MARGPEGAFWKRVRDAWPGHGLRIEASDGDVPSGTPDTVLSIGYRGGFVELKVWPDWLSSVQIAWHKDAVARGAYAMVLSELPDGRVWFGRGDEYNQDVDAKQVRPGRAMVLHEALSLIAFALTGMPIAITGGGNGVERRSTKGRS